MSLIRFSILFLSFFELSCSYYYEDPVIANGTSSTKPSFTFAQDNSSLVVPYTWSLTQKNQIFFHFRTHLSDAILAYFIIDSTDSVLLKVVLKNGKVNIMDFDDGEDNKVVVGKGLNKNIWHGLRITINTRELEATVDDRFYEKLNLPSWDRHANTSKLTGIFYFGGLDKTKYDFDAKETRFVGCMKEIKLGSSSNPSYASKAYPKHLYSGCYNRCRGKMFCSYGSKCINLYNSYLCDCFGTNYENKLCDNYDLVKVTMHGNEHISYRIYAWKDQVHSEINRISMYFKTMYENSVLFYGYGNRPNNNYIAASLVNGQVRVNVSFGDGEESVVLGNDLAKNNWHRLTIIHHGRTVEVSINQNPKWRRTMDFSKSAYHHLHFNPEIMIGASPNNEIMPGLSTTNKFVGSLHSVYYNYQNILLEMKDGSEAVHHHGIFPVTYGDQNVEDLPITFSFPTPNIVVEHHFHDVCKFSFDFKTNESRCVLVASSSKSGAKAGSWQISLEDFKIVFSVLDKSKKAWRLDVDRTLEQNSWHTVNFSLNRGVVEIVIDGQHKATGITKKRITASDRLVLGGSILEPQKGFVGCMRRINLNGTVQDSRVLIDNASTGISLDNCRLVNPCARPNICEHGGKCLVKDEKIICDCKDTGYIGKTCHFSIYNSSCEELYLSGYRKSGIYRIDIDRNGPFPPSHVFCKMDTVDEETGDKVIVTRILNNVPIEMAIWNGESKGFKFDVLYRDMTRDMLKTLIQSSQKCKQYIKYDCFNAPLGVGENAWFKSTSDSSARIVSLGDLMNNNTCMDGSHCSCDTMSGKHSLDEGVFTDKSNVGITEMFFQPPDELKSTSLSAITLGPLECIKGTPKSHSVKFKNRMAHLEIPGWQSGDLSFSFKTTLSMAELFYQSSDHGKFGTLRITLLHGNSVVFEFTVNNTTKKVELKFDKHLNDINWHNVRIDNDEHHLKFSVDTKVKMIELDENEVFGPFEGTSYIGAVPKHALKNSHLESHNAKGFQGCFKDLNYNNKAIEVQKYMPKVSNDLESGCSMNCKSNPCLNGGECKELWFGYECKCANKIISTGRHCEIEPVDAVTFSKKASFFTKLIYRNTNNTFGPVFEGNISLSFRTQNKQAVLYFANDNYNNFVQISIENSGTVVFIFNHLDQIVTLKNSLKASFSRQPINVSVKRTSTKTELWVNDDVVSSDHGVLLLDGTTDTKPNIDSAIEPDLVLKLPTIRFRQPMYIQNFIGGYDPEALSSALPGFTGCIQNWAVNDVKYSLSSLITVEPGISAGCNFLCDKIPCKNNGVCDEEISANSTTCDCTQTSYGGKTCEEDIGGGFDGENIIQFPLTEGYEESLEIKLAFSTNQNPEVQATLIHLLYPKSKFSFTLTLSKDGHIVARENNRVAGTSGHYNDGYRHWIIYSKDRFEIDGVDYREDTDGIGFYDPLNITMDSDTPVLRIGGSPTNKGANFIGCISNVELLTDVFDKRKPLSEVYGYVKEVSKQISVNVDQQSCAGFVPITLIPKEHIYLKIPPLLLGKEWMPTKPVKIPLISYEEPKVSTAKHSVVIALSVVFAIILVALICYLYHINQRAKRIKFDSETTFFSKRQSKKSKNRPLDEETIPLNNFAPLSDETPEKERRPESIYEPDGNDSPPKTPRMSASQELQWDPVINPVSEANQASPSHPNQSHDSLEASLNVDPPTSNTAYIPPLPPKTRQPPPIPPKQDDAEFVPSILFDVCELPTNVFVATDQSAMVDAPSPDNTISNFQSLIPIAELNEPENSILLKNLPVDPPNEEISADPPENTNEPLVPNGATGPETSPHLHPKEPFSFFKLGIKRKPRGKKPSKTPQMCHPLSPNHSQPYLPAPLPSFIDSSNKVYDNPLSYLGGPHIDYESDGTCSRRSSIKSVISLD